MLSESKWHSATIGAGEIGSQAEQVFVSDFNRVFLENDSPERMVMLSHYIPRGNLVALSITPESVPFLKDQPRFQSWDPREKEPYLGHKKWLAGDERFKESW